MAAKILRRLRAEDDLIEIWLFIASNNEAAAEQFLQRIEYALKTLAENPQAGRARPELGATLRSFPVGNYIIFYQIVSYDIEVIRVLSGYLDIQSDDVR
jgi:toxin ParE1/3/4